MKTILKTTIINLTFCILGCASTVEEPITIDDITPTGFWTQLGINTDFGTVPGINLLTTTASRRIAITRQAGEDTFLCAEPSPDVGEAFGAAFAAGVKATATSGTPLTGDIDAKTAKSLATQIMPLTYRTQGLLMYRQRSYNLCIQYLTGAISKEQYAEKEEKTWDAAVKEITEELPKMMEVQKTYYQQKIGNAPPALPEPKQGNGG